MHSHPHDPSRRRGRLRCLLALLALVWPVAPARATSPPPPGDHALRIRWDGLERHVIVHLPPAWTGLTPLPMVMLLHGGFGSGAQVAATTGMSRKADREGFVAVYPDGTGFPRSWNGFHCCGPAFRRGVDDSGFLHHVIELLKPRLKLDPDRVYVAGHSNGAIMAHRLAVEHPESIAAIAAVAGALTGAPAPGEALVPVPLPSEAPSVLLLHGLLDRSVPAAGGSGPESLAKAEHFSVYESFLFWMAAAGLGDRFTAFALPQAGIEGLVSLHDAREPTVRLEVALEEGHEWPGGSRDPDPLGGIDATDRIWEFFAAHPRRKR